MDFITQIVITIFCFSLLYLALKNSLLRKKRRVSPRRYKQLFNQLSTCLAMYEGKQKKNKGLKEGYVFNVQVDYDVVERKRILREIKELEKFLKPIATLNNNPIHKDFHFVIQEAHKGQAANLYKIRTRLHNIYYFLGRFLKRRVN